MDKRELLTFLEGYYGEKYLGVYLNTTLEYLEEFSENFYKAASLVLPRVYSREKNKAPGPAEFEKYKDRIYEAMPKKISLPEPTPPRATPEQWEAYMKAIKNILKPERKKEKTFIMKEGETYCKRTASELEELKKNGDYNGVPINIIKSVDRLRENMIQ